MRLNLTFRIRGMMYQLHFQSISIPWVKTIGMSARIPYSSHFVPFLDYDNIWDQVLAEHELPFLQELFGLGDFAVLKTGEHAKHAVCCDRLMLREVLEILDNSSCDYAFKRGIRYNEYRTWILRVVQKGNRPKPKYLFTVESPYNGQHLQSQAHAMFLQNYYGAKIRLVNPDGFTKLKIQRPDGTIEVVDAQSFEIQEYKTGSKVDREAPKHWPIIRRLKTMP